MPPILSLRSIRLTLGGAPLLEDAELVVAPGERVALVGRNGSGKSTLMRIAAGEIAGDGGERFVQPGATVRYLPQEPDFGGFATTLAYVEAGLGAADDPHRARHVLGELGLAGNEDPARLSGGEARRAALARVLAPDPDILLLDEPTNHLDLPAIEWLEAELMGRRGALVIVSHDRRVLTSLSRTTVWLDRGRTRRLDRGFGAFEAWRDATLAEEEKAEHRLARRIVREEHWLRYGVTARRKRNLRRLDELQALRRQKREARQAPDTVKMEVNEGDVSGRLVIDADRIAKRYADRAIIRDFTTRIMRADRIGIVGANGAGKTTLLRMLTGELAPDSGRVRLGTNLEVTVLDQQRAGLTPEMTLREALTGGGSDTLTIGGGRRHVMTYMRDFQFGSEQAGTPVGKLSGGERGRLALARALALPSNLIVLDEPTNDLDLETLDLLEEMIGDYPGTVLVVSHDRDFLDRVATALIVAEGDGRWTEYAGGYTDMLAQRGRGVRPAGAAPRPQRNVMPARAAGASQPPPPARKLSFRDKHALEMLPRQIEQLRAEIASLDAALADPGLYGRDPQGFARAGRALAEARLKLDAAEDRWLELEVMREELETR